MKIVKHTVNASREELINMLRDNEAVNKNVRFDDTRGTPHIHLKENGERITLTCEYIGGATRDNAFLSGTKFTGKIVEREGKTEISGIITTAPIFHLCLFAMFIAFVVVCIVKQGFNVVPIILLIFDFFMYKDEFKKQGIIDRYISRAIRRIK